MEKSEYSNQNKPRILFVDDEELICQYFARMCASDFHVTVAHNATQALRIFEQENQNFSMVVSDNRMPRMSGIELLSIFKTQCPNIICVLTTAFMDTDPGSGLGENNQIDLYIEKPWKGGALLPALKNILESHALSDVDKD